MEQARAKEALDTQKERFQTGIQLPLEVTQLEHIKIAKDFINLHGIETYNKSFAVAGLSMNVSKYTPAECSRHIMALQTLSKAA